MSYNLPTISSINRHDGITPRPRRSRRDPPPPTQVCSHRLTNFGGRCPQCYRDSLRQYGSRIRRIPLIRRNISPSPPPIAPPTIRRPHLPLPVFRPPLARPRAPRPRPRPIHIFSLPQRTPTPIVLPHIPIAAAPRRSTAQPSRFLSNLGLRLPGKCIIQVDKVILCSICYETYDKDANCQVLPCDHKFHAWCFNKWFLRKQNCPLCRRNYL